MLAESHEPPQSYKTRNWPAYNEALKRRVWRKIHLGVDGQTLEVRAVEITGNQIGVSPVLPDLLNQTPTEKEIASITADGAYDTRKCHDAIADHGANAVIPPVKNAQPWKAISAGAVARNEDALYETAGTAPHGTRL